MDVMGARSKRIARTRQAMPFATELGELAEEMNRVWWARHDSDERELWLSLPISKNNREDDVLATSNYEVAQRLIEEVAAFGTDYRLDAWPGGVIHTLLVRADDALALREAESIVNALQDYPILDEEDHSEREWEANHPSERECYSEDCSCEAFEHRELVEEHESGEAPYHVEGLAYGSVMPEYDIDGDWYCEVCEAWFEFTDAQKAEIAQGVERFRSERDRWDKEAKGQLVLVSTPLC